MEIKDYLTIIGIILALITLIKGIYEYKKAQNWKKLEFIAKEVKEFYNDFDTQRALLLLDWNMIDIPVRDGELINNPKRVLINDIILLSAFEHHTQITGLGYSENETLVRRIFDNFLFKLGIFNQYITTKLISEHDIKPYIIYWIELICDIEKNRKNKEIHLKLWKYINLYEFPDVIQLCQRYGYDISKYAT